MYEVRCRMYEVGILRLTIDNFKVSLSSFDNFNVRLRFWGVADF